jgi:hypothetical protein
MSEAFEPTDKDKTFLRKYLDRRPGDSIQTVCRRAGVGKNFFGKRKHAQGFSRWFYDQVVAIRLVDLLALQDRFFRQITGKLEDGEEKLSRYDLQFLKEWLDPIKQSLELRLKREDDKPLSPGEQLQDFAGFLDQQAKYKFCGECGMPLIPIADWRRGLHDGEVKLLEDKGAAAGG